MAFWNGAGRNLEYQAMSALGHKRTCAVQLGMSALCQKRTSASFDRLLADAACVRDQAVQARGAVPH